MIQRCTIPCSRRGRVAGITLLKFSIRTVILATTLPALLLAVAPLLALGGQGSESALAMFWWLMLIAIPATCASAAYDITKSASSASMAACGAMFAYLYVCYLGVLATH